MKYLLILLVLFSIGCTESTKYGKCIGISDKEDSKLDYRYSTNNIIVAIIFWETIFAPIIVLLDEVKCPEGPKNG
jgi:hypothetical protein